MRVTTKGQVTIPLEVRERLGIFPGTEVDFVVQGKSVNLVKAKPKKGRPSRGQRAVALLANKATDKSLSADQILILARGDD